MSKFSEKNVAIIGAGVSGLVSAVSMYKVGIRPIVFEKASNIGGMWNADIKPCWRSMRTNISKFSTALSDFPWPKNAPIFPSQREVYGYLANYVKESLPKELFRFGVQVKNVTYCDKKWTVEYRTNLDCTHVEQYDFLIVASGFFDCPHIPKNMTDLSSFQGTLMHSSNYYSPEQVKNQRVIIVGASMSAAEIAADMSVSATQIIHIVPHSFWSIPRFIPLVPNDPVPTFLPIDFVLYRQSKRISNHEISIRNSDENKRINSFMNLITGNSQQSSCLDDTDEDKPPFIAISDRYSEWLRSGKITLKYGRLYKIEKDGT